MKDRLQVLTTAKAQLHCWVFSGDAQEERCNLSYKLDGDLALGHLKGSGSSLQEWFTDAGEAEV